MKIVFENIGKDDKTVTAHCTIQSGGVSAEQARQRLVGTVMQYVHGETRILNEENLIDDLTSGLYGIAGAGAFKVTSVDIA
jgi:hypothetical protein